MQVLDGRSAPPTTNLRRTACAWPHRLPQGRHAVIRNRIRRRLRVAAQRRQQSRTGVATLRRGRRRPSGDLTAPFDLLVGELSVAIERARRRARGAGRARLRGPRRQDAGQGWRAPAGPRTTELPEPTRRQRDPFPIMMKEDNRNLLLAISLSVVVLFGWQYFYGVPQMESKSRSRSRTRGPEPDAPVPSPGAAPVPGAVPSQTAAPAVAPATGAVLTRDQALAQSPACGSRRRRSPAPFP